MLNFYRFRQDYLKFEGNDRLDLINRLSTNQVNTLQKNKGIKTVLTSDKGRFIDLITLYDFGDFVFVTCSFNNAPNVIAHLDKYTIMDDFRPVNMAGTHETILFFGEMVLSFINEKFGIDSGKFINNDFEIYSEVDRDCLAANNDDPIGGCIFIYSAEDSKYWNKFLFDEDAVKNYSINEISDEQFEEKRISLGIPEFGKEMTELTNPLECGLNDYVSFTKGCYIGQEVIARMDTYDKISKHMVKIEAEKEFKADGSKIINDGKECGFVTSALKDKGLGFVKTIFLDYEKDYQIKNNEILINCKLKQIKQ